MELKDNYRDVFFWVRDIFINLELIEVIGASQTPIMDYINRATDEDGYNPIYLSKFK